MTAPPDIDHSALRFPSDRLTLGDLRRLDPALFDGPGRATTVLLLDADRLEDLVLLVNLEREYARACFLQAAHGGGRSAEVVLLGEAVTDIWQEFGLAPGPVFAREMLADLEAAAAAQASAATPSAGDSGR